MYVLDLDNNLVNYKHKSLFDVDASKRWKAIVITNEDNFTEHLSTLIQMKMLNPTSESELKSLVNLQHELQRLLHDQNQSVVEL